MADTKQVYYKEQYIIYYLGVGLGKGAEASRSSNVAQSVSRPSQSKHIAVLGLISVDPIGEKSKFLSIQSHSSLKVLASAS